MTPSPDWVWRISSDLRAVGDVLMRISRTMHEHTHKLEVAVEGKYASESSDPRVRLLSEALQISRVADLELGRLDQSIQQAVKNMLVSSGGSGKLPTVEAAFEREREALNTSITTLQQQRDELGILYEIARTLNSTLEFDEVLRLVMDRVIEFVKAERGFIVLIDPATGEPEFTIARDNEARTLPRSEFATAQISRGVLKRVINSREAVLANDAQLDDALKAQASIMAYGIRSIMCAPLVVRDNCIGAVYVDSRINANLFGSKHRDLLLAFCNQAAIAIDNARLFDDLNKAIRQVRDDKQYMDNIFSSIANGVITTDSSGIITTFNNAASMILGIDKEKVIGKHYEEVFQELAQVGLVELLSEALDQRDLHLNSTFVPSTIACELPTRGPGLFNLNFYVSSLRDTQGSYIGTALVVDDRTELKRAEARAKQVRRIFERYVHPNVVQQLMKDPMALKLGGETKEISVVFADIRGYTRLSENMPPEEVMNLINRYHKIMCEAIWEEEGTLTTFQGDALMAIFNAPLLQKLHALHAVRAAWKMRMAVQEYQRSQPQETHVSFGIGVNTGLATVGNVGSQERMQNYTAIGDVVNVASRLQNNVSDNNILLNEPTYLQVYRYVLVGQPFELEVKNKSAPLTVRYLWGLAQP
ncbi:GAF domain-containing protein [Ktedonosporobacter rubrisoli]|uniref:GAF domain-containing protein n=1 Tax=Ktedonosporobacter rubrisoli TaxID=2509675 RepID=A0A4P6K2J2_KTERU|nr:adenylate/guanylate cyclase domain-containing protein [Ktedonosporobacter rubrisoli]QBD82235.1 GAF domain-containing protein [Ktedonosporobacter rubrisoli]